MLPAQRRGAEAAGIEWKAAIYAHIVRKEQGEGAMSRQRMCELAGVSRAGVYRFSPEARGEEKDVELRDAIQRIALENSSYGRRRITAELKRQGWQVNHKRVHRILGEDNLLCL